MTSWFHAAILATALVGTVAIGFASAAMLANTNAVAAKGDRLAVALGDGNYRTVETRTADGSILTRVQVN